MGTLDCLDDDVLIDLIERRVSQDTASRIQRHISGCPPCRTLLIEVSQAHSPPEEIDVAPWPEMPHAPASGSPAASPTGTWEPPMQFDGFCLEREIGRGGMGIVYLAHDTHLDREVAIKFIAERQPSETARAYFMTEARAIARLTHPNVVTVHRVGEVEEHPYLVSEYVSGQRLAEVKLPVPWRRVLGIGRGLARGLGAAHRQGVLHRDIKPSNVILTSDGEVKLLDFGLAELSAGGAEGTATTRRDIAGTLLYMAPELLSGAPATMQSDIYALGLVLYELCTGKVPKRRRALTERPEERLLAAGDTGADATVSKVADALREVVTGIDPDFTALIERCLRPDPRERFASVEALEEQLERLHGDVATPSMSAVNPYRGLAPFEAEHRRLFFGRDSDIRAVLDRLRREPLVLITGDSGTGKSSLCRAGILPRVADGMLDRSREYTLVSLWPGRRPVAALAAAMAPVLGKKEAELGAALAATSEVAWFGQELRELCRDARGVLLLVDQLEELFTLSDPAEAARFAAILAELALPSPGVRVLLTVRGDFFTRLAALPGLGAIAPRAPYLLGPLSAEGVREAIVGPARSRGVVFESEALIADLMTSKERGAGGLPLLQFALAELWERRDKARQIITQAALESMGRVAGALSRHADGVLVRLSPAQRQAARRILVRLVAERGTRASCTEAELGIVDDDARGAVRTLVEGRLLCTVPSGDAPIYQIAHEALIESWGALRTWLDEDRGHRALRQRIEAASAEWERLERSNEVLWSARQLDETLPLEPATLGPRERAFLGASRRRVLWRRRLVGGLAVLTVVALLWAGVRLEAHLRNRRSIAKEVATAQAEWARGHAHAARAQEQRETALLLFDGRSSPAPAAGAGSWDEAEQVWRETLAKVRQAEEAYTLADEALSRSLLRDSSRHDVRQLLLELTYERILLAEQFYQSGRRNELTRLLTRLDEERQWEQRLLAPAELSVDTNPRGARVELLHYVQDKMPWTLERITGLDTPGTTPMAPVHLPPGSYLLKFTLPGHAPATLPIVLERGERRQIRIPLPALVPEGYVYVPPGCFLFGSGDTDFVREFMHTAPLHRLCMDQGYVIGQTEITVSDWLAYLNALPEDAPVRRLFAEPRLIGEGMLLLRYERRGGWYYSFSASKDSKDWPPPRREGELFQYTARSQRAAQDWRQFPMVGVSLRELEGYLHWLDRSGRVPGARLCREDEWERAARGADDRRYPHGDRLLPEEANIDATYGRKTETFGPDAVGSHPASASPFGLLDVAGNAFEWTTSMPSEPGVHIIRGGAWYYDARLAALAFNRTPNEPNAHDVRLGVRVCAPVSVR